MLHRELAYLGIENAFDRILGSDNIYAAGKVEMAKRYLGQYGKKAVLIGDTPHDADTAHAIGADCILYTGGHASVHSLKGTGFPTVDHLTEIVSLL